jgi:hypothetical protein
LAAEGKTTLPAHQWIHVVGAFDGTNITVYFNGRLDETTVVKAPYTPSSYPLRIGHAAFSLDTHRKFDGKIDDVMIWKRTLSEREIRAVYEDQKDARPAPLVAADIAGLIEQLGSAKFKRREEAQQQPGRGSCCRPRGTRRIVSKVRIPRPECDWGRREQARYRSETGRCSFTTKRVLLMAAQSSAMNSRRTL